MEESSRRMEESSIMAGAPDFIPSNEFKPDEAAPSSNAPDFIPNSEFQPDSSSEKDFGSPSQQAITALEQGASGASLGTSKLVETKLLGVDPKDIEAREEANPITATLSNIGGTAATIAATGGLGFEAAEGASLLARAGSNAVQGAIIGSANSASNDLALGDPNLNASKLLSHAGMSALYGGILGGVGSAVLEGLPSGLKSLATLGKNAAGDVPVVAPEALGALDKIRLGLFTAMDNPAAKEQLSTRMSEGLSSLNDLTSIENLGLTTQPQDAEVVQRFLEAQKPFLKEFGTGKGNAIDHDELLSFITNPSAKNSTQQTVSFNHYLNAIKDLSKVGFKDADLNGAIQDATGSLKDWTDALADANFTTPHIDIEYGGPAVGDYNSEPQSYSTKYDLPPGKEITPNYAEGVTIGKGENASRVSSFGSERASTFDQIPRLSLKNISSKIEDYQKQISDLLEKQQTEVPIKGGDILESLEGAENAGNQIKNVATASHAIANPPEPLGAGLATIAAHVPYGSQLFSILSAIRKYSGDGGLFRLGGDLASPLKILDGVAHTIEKVDNKIGDKARLIFTGTSSQARKIDHE